MSPCVLSMHEQMIIILQDEAFDIHIWDLAIPHETLCIMKFMTQIYRDGMNYAYNHFCTFNSLVLVKGNCSA